MSTTTAKTPSKISVDEFTDLMIELDCMKESTEYAEDC